MTQKNSKPRASRLLINSISAALTLVFAIGFLSLTVFAGTAQAVADKQRKAADFLLSRDDNRVLNDAGGLVSSVVTVGDFAALQQALMDPTAMPQDSAYTIQVAADIVAEAPLTIPQGKTVTLTSADAEAPVSIVRGFEEGALFTIPNDTSGATALYLENITLNGNDLLASGPLISNQAKLTVSSGARLVNNINTATPGGAILNKGSLLIRDAEVSGNAAVSGNAIQNNGELTLNNNVQIPCPGGISFLAAENAPIADMLADGSTVSIERSKALASSGHSVIAAALPTFTLTSHDLDAFFVCSDGFDYRLNAAKTAVEAVPITYTIDYHFNESSYSNPSANLSKMHVFSPLLQLIAPSATQRTNEHFVGWYTAEKDGTRIDTISPQRLPLLADENGTIKLYAHFSKERPQLSTIVYEGYDETSHEHSNPTTILKGETIEISDIYSLSTTATDGTFLGWFTKPEGGVKVDSVTSDTVGTITLYAQWATGGTATVPSTSASVSVSQSQHGTAAQAQTVREGEMHRMITAPGANHSFDRHDAAEDDTRTSFVKPTLPISAPGSRLNVPKLPQ